MNSGSGVEIPAFKAFVSEEELDKKRQARQEEWEKVRKPDDPEEAPEEPFDGRCLFDKLQEQKLKKEEEYHDQFRLINQVKGLDEDEAIFLDQVSERQTQVLHKRNQEDSQVLEEFQQAMLQKNTQQKVPAKDTLVAQVKQPCRTEAASKKKNSQALLLQKAIKRKCTDTEAEANSKTKKQNTLKDLNKIEVEGNDVLAAEVQQEKSTNLTENPSMCTKISSGLPGIGNYSDSDNSASDDEES